MLLRIVEDEVENRLLAAVIERLGTGIGVYHLGRAHDRARRRLDDLTATLDRLDPAWSAGEMAAARAKFEAAPRDLTRLVGRPKEPIPDRNDLQIMIQSSKIETPTHIFSNDAHFIGYADELRAWWGLTVHRAAYIPLLLEQWGGRSRDG